MNRVRVTSFALGLLSLFVLAAVLWKGGKALDIVWCTCGIACLLTVIQAFWTGSEQGSLNRRVWWLMILFVLWTMMSFAVSSVRTYGFDELITTIALVLLACFAARAQSTHKSFAVTLARIISVATLLACGVGVFVYILQPVSRFAGTFFDYRFHTDYWPNAWAEFLLLSLPLLCWSLFLRRNRDLVKITDTELFRGIVLGFVLGCFFLSFSRGGIIALGLEVIIFMAFILWKMGNKISWKKILMVSIASGLTAVVTFVSINSARSRFHTVESVAAKATFTSAEGTSSLSERMQFWKQAVQLAKQEPLYGYGPYSFRFVQPHIQTDVLATSDHPHNVFLKLAMERGIVASLLLLAILIATVLLGFLKIRNEPVSPHSLLTVSMITAIGGVLAHNMIDYNLQFMGIAVPLWLMMGILASGKSGPHARKRQIVEITGAVILSLLLLYEGTMLVFSSRARRAEAKGNTNVALEFYAKADGAFFPRDAFLSEGVLLLSGSHFADAEAAALRSVNRNPEDARGWRLLGDIYLAWHKERDALSAYEKAFRYGSHNDIGIVRGLVYLLKNDRKLMDARRHEIELLMNDFGLAIEQNTHFIALGPNVEELVSLCDLMASLYPEDAAIYRQLAKKSMDHATEERARLASRTRGLLW